MHTHTPGIEIPYITIALAIVLFVVVPFAAGYVDVCVCMFMC
jgi:ACR3 family arsenite efflux pump ArsB